MIISLLEFFFLILTFVNFFITNNAAFYFLICHTIRKAFINYPGLMEKKIFKRFFFNLKGI